jgi:hypothetical protein
MKHPRTDYQGIQDTTGQTSIKEDEPVFLLRAQDALAPSALRYWAGLLKEAGGDLDTANNILKFADEMVSWQYKNGRKTPDTPKEKLCA